MQMVDMEVAGNPGPVVTARSAGLVGCTRCGRVWPLGTHECTRCGSTLVSRDRKSIQRVWAWLLAGVICYIPANLFPMLRTRTFFSSQDNTIVGGAVELIHHGSYAVALIILIASVLIPMGKFAVVAYLAYSVKHKVSLPAKQRQAFYEIVEYIGRWSMIDVFVVAILSSLVQLNIIVSITPGPASLTFALSVIFTMLAAQSFDSRMIWDAQAEADAA